MHEDPTEQRLVINVDVDLPVEDRFAGPWEPAQQAAEMVGLRLAAELDHEIVPRKVFANRPGVLRVYWVLVAPSRLDAIRQAVDVLARVTDGVGQVAEISALPAGTFQMSRGMNWDDPRDT